MNVTLKVVEARNLAKMDTVSLSDPFCVIIFGNQNNRTKTIMNDQNPHWNETFTYKNVSESAKLKIEVYDYDTLKSNDYMGEIELEMSTLKANPSAWWPLYGKGDTQAEGDIYIEVTFN